MPGSPKVRPPIHPNGDHTTIGNDRYVTSSILAHKPFVKQLKYIPHFRSQLLIDNLRCDQLAKSIDRDYSEDRDITDENADTAENFDNDDTYTDEPAITETDNVTESPPSEPPTERPHHTNYLNKWNILIFVVVALIALLWRESSKTLAKNINCDVSLLKNEFPEQNQLFWKTLKSGIESTVNKDPTIPSVFLVVYQDKDLIQKFANQIINFTQNCMETNLYKPVILTNAELSGAEVLRDYGNAIEQYRTQIADSGVLFVEDLNTVSNFERWFHFANRSNVHFHRYPAQLLGHFIPYATPYHRWSHV